MKYTLVEYSSNNSGGSWWLKDEDWLNLEKNGWEINWCKDDPFYIKDWGKGSDWDGRWLGALAKSATFKGTMREAIDSFNIHSGNNARDLGCSCCGTPHDFSLQEYDTEKMEEDGDDYYPNTLEYWSPSFPAQGEEY